MAKIKMVWLGPGVFTRAGKIYKIGDVMPPGIDKDELEKLRSKGRAGNPIKAVDLSETESFIKNQSDLIKKLQAEILEKDKLIAELEKTMPPKDPKPNEST